MVTAPPKPTDPKARCIEQTLRKIRAINQLLYKTQIELLQASGWPNCRAEIWGQVRTGKSSTYLGALLQAANKWGYQGE